MATLDPFIGRVLGERYRITKRLGQGAFGWVYHAVHVRLDSPFAVKILNTDPRERPDLGARFEREAKLTSKLRHPNIVTVFDYGEEPEVGLYLVMEYLQGQSLEARVMSAGGMPPAEVVSIALQVAAALGVAHKEGLVHRDVKPSNVMLLHEQHRRDTAMVLDFGIAGLTDGRSSLTGANSAIGSPAYMSPEVIQGRPADARSDIYSFGVMLYEMTTGRLPFWSDNFIAIYSMHIEDAPTPPRQVCTSGGIPESLETLILRCLQKAPADRFQSMSEVETALGWIQVELARGTAPSVARGGAAAAMPTKDPPGPVVHRLETQIPSPGTDPALDATAVAVARPESGSHGPAAVTMTSATPAMTRRRGPVVAALVAVLALAAAVGVFFALRPDGAPAPDRDVGAVAAAAPEPDAPAPPAGATPAAEADAAPEAPAPPPAPLQATAAPVAETAAAAADVVAAPDAGEGAAASGAAAAGSPDASSSGAAEPQPFRYRIASEPAGAIVFEGDTKLGAAPLTLSLDPAAGPRTLRLELDGHQAEQVLLDPEILAAEGSGEQTVKLRAVPKKRPPRKRPKSGSTLSFDQL